ncbi:MAG: hypothetical protein QQW96_00935 [Tychonema bourrellyi B0820]|uniref:Lipoprotein n=1 Tax=Tychonema bourrellyi FEM_GT703 TaxID=2040638 RepID=A0A2G4F3E5_9CYAN|nr:hypothetical protein [Tychonema bourrellyi]MDQ2096203.1 hypothetical protein [Tychonema bourrellyi B0820]PHX56282.1 hypothetical protein CP500_006375 [Tychonema bourrellyi FEM_GT703]
MKNYTTIALLSLSGLFLSATCAFSIESPVEQVENSTTQYMLSAQTQQRGDSRPIGKGRLSFIQPSAETQPLQ